MEPHQTANAPLRGSRHIVRPHAAPRLSPVAGEVIGALRALVQPVPLPALAELLERSEDVVRIELGRARKAGYVVLSLPSGMLLARSPGRVRLCAVCHRPLRRSNPDPQGICDPCRQGAREKKANRAEQLAERHHFRLMVLIRLAVQWGEVVDLAAYFETTDRRRIAEAVRWWRERGAVINAMPTGGYKIVDWRDESTAGTR